MAATRALVELVVEGLTGKPEEDWLLENNGAGIIVAEPKVFGRVYLHAPHDDEDSHFVAAQNDVCSRTTAALVYF